MKAIVTYPHKKSGVSLVDVEKPQIVNSTDILVKILRTGIDGTDKEIINGEYGVPPKGVEFLILGHETVGIIEKVGADISTFQVGDLIVPTVRRPGSSIYDKIGTYDMSTADDYMERGINGIHGFLTDYFLDQPEYLIKVPLNLNDVAVLLEPTSIVIKGIRQAYEIQRRLKVWQPKRAAVLGTGTIGLLAALMLRLKGLKVCSFGLKPPPNKKSKLLNAIDVCYHSTKDITLEESASEHGPYDIIFEATGYSPLAFEAMKISGKNSITILSSVTVGTREITISADEINLDIVLGNKVIVGTVNANRDYFEEGVKELSHAQFQWPGWLNKLLTNPVKGLTNYKELFRQLQKDEDAIKVFAEIHPLST